MILTEPFTRRDLLPNSEQLEGVPYILGCIQKDILENSLDGPVLDSKIRSSIGYVLAQCLDNVHSETDMHAVKVSNIPLIESRLKRINPIIGFYYVRTALPEIRKLWQTQKIEDLSLIRRLSEDLKSGTYIDLESYSPIS